MMPEMTATGVLRLLWFVNVGLCVVALPLIIWKVRRDWAHIDPSTRFLALALAVFVAVACFGSVESLAQDVTPGYRSIGVTVAVLWVIAGSLYRTRAHAWVSTMLRRQRRKPDHDE